MDGLEELDSILKESSELPTNLDYIYFLFFEKGIDYFKFNKLPIPYILSILKTHEYKLDQEEKAYKKAQRKR